MKQERSIDKGLAPMASPFRTNKAVSKPNARSLTREEQYLQTTVSNKVHSNVSKSQNSVSLVQALKAELQNRHTGPAAVGLYKGNKNILEKISNQSGVQSSQLSRMQAQMYRSQPQNQAQLKDQSQQKQQPGEQVSSRNMIQAYRKNEPKLKPYINTTDQTFQNTYHSMPMKKTSKATKDPPKQFDLDDLTLQAMHNPVHLKPQHQDFSPMSYKHSHPQHQEIDHHALQSMTGTNLSNLFDINQRVCLCCNDHLRHETIKYKYPTQMQSAYLKDFKRNQSITNQSKDQGWNINHVSRNPFANGQKLLGEANSKLSFQNYGIQNYQGNPRFKKDDATGKTLGRSKTSFVMMADITPFIGSTTNKATYPFWPSGVAKQHIENPEANTTSIQAVMKQQMNIPGQTAYNELYLNPKSHDSQIDQKFSSDNLRQMFKSYSNLLVSHTVKMDGKSHNTDTFIRPESQYYNLDHLGLVKDSLQTMAGVKVNEKLLHPHSKKEYTKKENDLLCDKKANYRQRKLFYS